MYPRGSVPTLPLAHLRPSSTSLTNCDPVQNAHRVKPEHEAKLKKLFKHDGEGTDEVTQDAGMETVGTLDYAGFKDNAKHIYGDTKKVVHDFRKDMEEKTMGPIFGSLGTYANRDVNRGRTHPACLPYPEPNLYPCPIHFNPSSGLHPNPNKCLYPQHEPQHCP